MTGIFTVEALFKIIALGFLFNGQKSYLRDPWNFLDFIIVLSGLTSFILDSNIGFIKVLRIMRILRPLRLITRVKGLKIVITSLFNALPPIFNLQLVVLFFIYSFAILMTTLFSGKLHSCDLNHISGLSALQKFDLIKTKWDCLNYGGEWKQSFIHLDNSMHSMMVIFVL